MKLFKSLVILVSVVLLSVSFVAGQDAEMDLSEMAWEDVVAQAQEEGELFWFQWYFQPRFREFVVTFEEEYGIEVTVVDGPLDGNMQKLLAESGREMGDMDVLSTGFDQLANLDLEELFVSLETLPDFEKLTTELAGVDGEGYAVAWWGNQTGFAYRPERIAEDELPQTFEELTAFMEANPQEFGIGDPNGGGSGPSFLQAMIREFGGDLEYKGEEVDEELTADWELAWEWLEGQSDNFVITGGNADSLTRINDGEFTMVAAWEDHLAGLQKEGEISEDIAFYIPEFGMNGGGNAVTIPANAPNKAAAMLFIHWLTSPETQSELNVQFGSSPQHPEASDEFALVPNAQREFRTVWMDQPYGELINQTFIDRIMMGQ